MECGGVTWDVCAVEVERVNPKIKVQNMFQCLDSEETNEAYFKEQKTELNFGNFVKVVEKNQNQKKRKKLISRNYLLQVVL